jgi:replicative DNA helicase
MDVNHLPVPPQNLQAEQSVIGGCLIDSVGYGRVNGLVKVEDFYDHRHKIIFNAIAELVSAGSAVDILLVDDYLQGKGLSENVGGLGYLGSLAMNTPAAANISHYAGIVREKSILRQVIDTAQQMLELAMSAAGDAKSIISDAEHKIFALGQQGLRGKRGFVRIREALGAVVDEMERNFDAPPKDGVRGLSSGFDDLDALTGGFGPGDLVLLAARPSMGKTALAMNIAEHVAMVKNKPVAVFSMEMEREAIAQRCLSSVSGAGLRKIRESWTIQDDEWTLLNAGISRLSKSPLFIDDSAGLTIGGLRSRALRLASELSDEFPDGIGLVVVDYIQLMGVEGSAATENRNGQIEVISRGLKQLAKELGCPVLALSQLNRNLESRPNKRPVMSDLRDSGSLEQDADLILFPYRDEVYNKESVDVGTAELIIGKQRNGPLGTVRLVFDGSCARFRNFAHYAGGYE